MASNGSKISSKELNALMDFISANQIGMYTIWIKQGNWKDACPREKLEQPDMTVENMRELCEKIL